MDRPASPAGSAPGPVTVALAVVLLCMIWGSTWIVIKAGLRDLPVLSSAAARFTVAALVFALIAPLLHRREGGHRPAPWLSLSMGLFNFAISYGIVYTVEAVIPSGLTSVLWAVFPMLTAALAHVWLPGERLRAPQWVGFSVGFLGVAVLFATDLRGIGPQAVWAGALLLLSPLSSAVGQVVLKRHAKHVSATLLNRNGMLVGAAGLWLVALPLERQSTAVLSATAIGSVAYLAVVGTVISFGVYFWLLRYVSASRLSLIAYVTPAIALWLGFAVGDEPLARSTVAGSALILLGIALALTRGRSLAANGAPVGRARRAPALGRGLGGVSRHTRKARGSGGTLFRASGPPPPVPMPTDDELIERWRHEPAPLLPLLHAFHDRDGFLGDAALRTVAKGLKIPIADLFGTVTFYHHFARQPPGQSAPRVCDGPICRLHGAEALLHALPGATPMPCAGRCDAPIPVLVGAQLLVGHTAAELHLEPSPLPPPYPGDAGECVFADIRTPGRATLLGYRATGGYEALTAARGRPATEIIDVIGESGLAGRGGAGFPTGRKWQAVAQAPGTPKTIVCNADEGEPGCFKDRALMDHDPHALVEGMAIAALATGAVRGFIYLRYEYPETHAILERAIAEAEAAGLLPGFALYVRRGAGAYVCGEETSLLNSLEGKHPFPRNRPPFPVTHGFEGLPTVVNNVETLCAAAPILRRGAAWYRGLGLGTHAGTKVISLSGDVLRPGNYEVPIGLPLRTLLYDWAGGPGPGRTVQAVTMAGLSGGLLGPGELDVTLDEPCLRGKGSFLGAGGIMVFDDTRDMVAVAHEAMEFFAHESCGKCFPCRIGTTRLTERLAPFRLPGGGGGPTDLATWTAEVVDIGDAMKATSACGLGTAAPLITDSLLKYFPDQVARHLARRKA